MAAARLNILSTAAEDTYVQPKLCRANLGGIGNFLSRFVFVHAGTSSTYLLLGPHFRRVPVCRLDGRVVSRKFSTSVPREGLRFAD